MVFKIVRYLESTASIKKYYKPKEKNLLESRRHRLVQRDVKLTFVLDRHE